MKRLIFAGGGHGHIYLLKKMAAAPLKELEVLLISDFDRQYYSGMIPGFLEGIYSEAEASFDLAALCKAAGVRFIHEKIKAIDGIDRVVETSRGSYGYDFLSMNLGSDPVREFGPKKTTLFYVKPIANLVALKTALETRPDSRVVIIGAGAAGTEIALTIKSRFRDLKISIIDEMAAPIPNFNVNSQERVLELFQHHGIDFYPGVKVLEAGHNHLELSTGRLDFDLLLVAGGVTGTAVSFRGFTLSPDNYVKVDEYLFADDNTLAMGDMIWFEKYPNLKKAGVFAIKEAPVLYANLMKRIQGQTDYRSFKPQEKYLAILNAGEKKAIMDLGAFSLYGSLPFRLKNKIDKAYMKLENKNSR